MVCHANTARSVMAQVLLERMLARHGADGAIRVRSGGIANYAREQGAALIVMPSHGRTGLSHLLIGSVAERVVRYASCPVLVLRGMKAAHQQTA